MAIKDFLDAVAPKYASPLARGSVEILEHDPKASVRKVIWSGADFQHMNHLMAKDMTAFFDLAGSPDIFRYDCDGVVLFESEGKKYMFLTELKSGFGTDVLMKAKRQIISSFIKTNMILHLSPCYRLEDYIVKGFVVGYPPKQDFLYNLHKASMLPTKGRMKEMDLTKRLFLRNPSRSLILKPTDFLCLTDLPLGDRGIFPSIELHFIEVAPPLSDVTLSVRNFI